MNNKYNSEKNKINLKERKNRTLNSIKEIELFLCNFEKAIKSFKIYKFFK